MYFGDYKIEKMDNHNKFRAFIMILVLFLRK